jgi:hypothetical protein
VVCAKGEVVICAKGEIVVCVGVGCPKDATACTKGEVVVCVVGVSCPKDATGCTKGEVVVCNDLGGLLGGLLSPYFPHVMPKFGGVEGLYLGVVL